MNFPRHLLHVSNFVSESTKEENTKIVRHNALLLYQLLQEIDKSKVKQKMFDIREMKQEKEQIDAYIA